MRKALLAALLVVAALLALACGEGGDEVMPAVALRLALDVPSEVQVGETVPLKLTVENVAEVPVEFHTGGRPDTNYVGGYDFVVAHPDGSEVWSWLKSGVVVEAILSKVTLQPDEQLQFEQEWPQKDLEGRPVGPGEYLVRGVLTGETTSGQRFQIETLYEGLVISVG